MCGVSSAEGGAWQCVNAALCLGVARCVLRASMRGHAEGCCWVKTCEDERAVNADE